MGLRGVIGDTLNTSIALWRLYFDSELLFVGDASNAEAGRPSQRYSIAANLCLYYRFNEHRSLDLQYAGPEARFRDQAEEGQYIPSAVDAVLQAGLSADFGGRWFGSVRLSYAGGHSLDGSGEIRSAASRSTHLRSGHRWQNTTLTLDVLNLFDSRDHDIDYLYASRLQNEPEGTDNEDIHYRVLAPRRIKFRARYYF